MEPGQHEHHTRAQEHPQQCYSSLQDQTASAAWENPCSARQGEKPQISTQLPVLSMTPAVSPLQEQTPRTAHELYCTDLLCGPQGGSSVLLLLHGLGAPQPARAARGDQPHLASRGSVPADGRGLPDVLVVASSEGMLHRLPRGEARQQCNHRNWCSTGINRFKGTKKQLLHFSGGAVTIECCQLTLWLHIDLESFPPRYVPGSSQYPTKLP